MASASEISLQTAVHAVDEALARLEAAAEVANTQRALSAAEREAVQAEISQSWQEHSAQIETALTEAQSENNFLREDNLRLSNQLQKLQQEFLALQKATGSAVNRLDGSVKQLDLILELEH